MANMQLPGTRLDSFGQYVRHHNKGMALVIVALLAITALAGCGGGAAVKEDHPDAASSTASPTSTTSTTTVNSSNSAGGTNINVDVRREVDPNAPVIPNNTTVEMGSDAPAGVSGSDGDKVHVNMPGVHVNVDHANGAKDIDVPFVHIHKDAQGHTDIDVPFVHVDKDQ